MKLNWDEFLGKMTNVIMNENYGVVNSENNNPFYEIVFKTGKLISHYDEGLILESEREGQKYKIFIPHTSIKCLEIYEI